MRHTLSCSNGGIIIAHHNEICDETVHLAIHAFFPHCVRGVPLIHLGHIISEEEVCHGESITETWGGVSIRGLWEIDPEATIDVRFGDSDADSWKSEGLDNIFPL